MSEPSPDDFLDTTPYAASGAAMAGDVETLAARPRRRVPAAAATAGWLALGLAVGGIGVAAWHNGSGTAAATGAPAAANGGFGAPGQGSTGQNFGGGRDGEQRIAGRLSGIGASSITVTTTGGATTYPIDSSTQIEKNGQPVALSALATGDQVLVHVYPANGTLHVERVLDGFVGGRGFGGPPPATSGGTSGGMSGAVTHT